MEVHPESLESHCDDAGPLHEDLRGSHALTQETGWADGRSFRRSFLALEKLPTRKTNEVLTRVGTGTRFFTHSDRRQIHLQIRRWKRENSEIDTERETVSVKVVQWRHVYSGWNLLILRVTRRQTRWQKGRPDLFQSQHKRHWQHYRLDWVCPDY